MDSIKDAALEARWAFNWGAAGAWERIRLIKAKVCNCSLTGHVGRVVKASDLKSDGFAPS